MLFTATYCPRCTGKFMYDREDLFCINCGYIPRIKPLEEVHFRKEPRFDYRNKPKKVII